MTEKTNDDIMIEYIEDKVNIETELIENQRNENPRLTDVELKGLIAQEKGIVFKRIVEFKAVKKAISKTREAERIKYKEEKTFKEYRVCACDQVGNVLAQMQTCYSDDIPRVVNVIKENLRQDTINVDGLDFVVYERTVGNWKIINHVH